MRASDLLRTVGPLVAAVGLAVLVLMLAVSVAHAQASDREQEQLRRLRLQVQQLQQQQQAAQEQAAAAQAALAKAQGETQGAREAQNAERGRTAAQGRRVAELERELAALRGERETWVAERESLTAELSVSREETVRRRRAWRATEASLIDTQGQLAKATQRAERGDGALTQCRADNATLVKLGDDLVDRLLGTSLWERARASEPLLQLGRVQLENLGQRYREQIVAARQRPEVGAAATSGAGQRAP